jgi:hypothetical protein
MAKLKPLTKAEKSEKLAALKDALKLSQAPLDGAKLEHRKNSNALKAVQKAHTSSNAKLLKFLDAAEIGKAKIQAKIDAIHGAPTLIEARIKAASAPVQAKKVVAKAVAKAKALPLKPGVKPVATAATTTAVRVSAASTHLPAQNAPTTNTML